MFYLLNTINLFNKNIEDITIKAIISYKSSNFSFKLYFLPFYI